MSPRSAGLGVGVWRRVSGTCQASQALESQREGVWDLTLRLWKPALRSGLPSVSSLARRVTSGCDCCRRNGICLTPRPPEPRPRSLLCPLAPSIPPVAPLGPSPTCEDPRCAFLAPNFLGASHSCLSPHRLAACPKEPARSPRRPQTDVRLGPRADPTSREPSPVSSPVGDQKLADRRRETGPPPHAPHATRLRQSGRVPRLRARE